MKYVINAKFLGQTLAGSQQVGLGLSAFLKEQLDDARFVTTKKVINQKTFEELDAISVGSKTNTLWEQYELLGFLRKNGNPLLIDFGNTAPVFYKNKVTTILDISPNLHPEWYSYKHRYYLMALTNLYIKNSRKVLTISNFCKDEIIRHYKVSPDFVEVIHCACPFEIKRLSTQNSDYSNPYGRYILGVSHIHSRKNFLGLIRAFKQSKIADTRLVVVGGANSVSSDPLIQSEIPDDGSIIFTGYISTEELVNLYKNALFFIYPSFYEGFGIPPLEAMANGCPTIVSNTSSLPEVCGDASLYVDPYDIESISSAIKKLSTDQDLRANLIKKGYEREEKFSWKKSADKLVQCIKSLE
jgi:glycosyltransferase involved in cell wall biosynthesis